MIRSHVRLIALAVLLAGGSCSGDDALPSNGRPVILVSIDSLRADHCSAYGYRARFAPDLPTTPFMESIAADGVLFEQAVSPTSWTLPAHMSLLTGLGCVEHGVRDRNRRLPDDVETLAARFRRAGYATAGFFSGPLLHPAWGFGRGFDTYRGVLDYSIPLEALAQDRGRPLAGVYETSHFDALCSERVVDAGLQWLADEERRRGPFFLFLHLWDPHYDYAPPEALAERMDPEYDGPIDGQGFMARGERWSGRDLEHWIALYDAEIRYTDDQLARFWGQIESWGIADDVVLLVTSDHGEEFYEHGKKGHNKSLFEEVVRVPLVLRAPDLAPAGVRVPSVAGLVDVYPTLLDLSGVPVPDDLTGESLRPAWSEDAGQRGALVLDLHAPGFNSVLRGWRGDRTKVIWNLHERSGLRFDLLGDPGERSGQIVDSLEGPGLSRVRRDFDRAEAKARNPAPMTTPAELRSELERLGYVGVDAED